MTKHARIKRIRKEPLKEFIFISIIPVSKSNKNRKECVFRVQIYKGTPERVPTLSERCCLREH